MEAKIRFEALHRRHLHAVLVIAYMIYTAVKLMNRNTAKRKARSAGTAMWWIVVVDRGGGFNRLEYWRQVSFALAYSQKVLA